jgi:hypothetical protein
MDFMVEKIFFYVLRNVEREKRERKGNCFGQSFMTMLQSVSLHDKAPFEI